ncbi:hypothetical protein COLO4_26589 [Corchorus olitorius]|uniref:Uncharacterized protein n=1 Tax=Corchorus olitorius TaxID=93759 RepID=A0A1R3HWC4_9ROSI|nr:hypothetical protein COLO4_26589 [Corchorus olitorius]
MILVEEMNYKEVSHEYGNENGSLFWDESESQELTDCVEVSMEHKSKNPRKKRNDLNIIGLEKESLKGYSLHFIPSCNFKR